MKKYLITLLIVLAVVFIQSKPKYEVGLLLPIEHTALEKISQGFIEILGKDRVDLQNGQGDPLIQQAILDTFIRQKYAVIATIGTDLTAMATQKTQTIPIVAIDVTDHIEHKKNITGSRESSVQPSYIFLKTLFPNAKKFAIVYSCSEKNFELFEQCKKLADQDSLTIQPIMVQSLADLYILANSIEDGVSAIFSSKDNLVASGAPILRQIAKEKRIPYISCDEGTVKNGSCAALGNQEEDIGRYTAEIALQILNGKKPSEIPMTPIQKQSIFLNPTHCQEQGLEISRVKEIAAEMGIAVKEIS